MCDNEEHMWLKILHYKHICTPGQAFVSKRKREGRTLAFGENK